MYTVTDNVLAVTSPLRIGFVGHDSDSGLARTNTGGAEASNTTLSVANIATNNVTNYVPSESSAVTTSAGSNMWSWAGLDPAALDSLVAAGSNG